MSLKANKGFTYFRDTPELRCRVADGAVSQLQKMRQLRLVEFANALADVLRQDEIEKGLKLQIIVAVIKGLLASARSCRVIGESAKAM